MRGFIYAAILMPSIALSQNMPAMSPNICTFEEYKDKVEIRDNGPGQAIVTYYDSAEQCSTSQSLILTAPNGISVRVEISIGTNDDNAETIYVTPDTQYMAIPPEASVVDGDSVEIHISGGLF